MDLNGHDKHRCHGTRYGDLRATPRSCNPNHPTVNDRWRNGNNRWRCLVGACIDTVGSSPTIKLTTFNPGSTSVSKSHPPLSETLARLDALIAERGLDRAEVLDIPELSRRTLLTEGRISRLLAGEELPEESINERVSGRVKILFEKLVAKTGKRATDVRREIASQLDVSPEWVRLLTLGSKVPTIEHGIPLQEYFEVYFGTEEGFLWATNAQLLNKALQSTLTDIERHPVRKEPESTDPIELLKELGLAGVATRANALSHTRKNTLAKKIREWIDEGDE